MEPRCRLLLVVWFLPKTKPCPVMAGLAVSGVIVASIYPIIALVLVFALVILVHEFGHMIVARLNGVDVTDFGIGLGPSLLSKKIGSTRYHICAFPLGGFVKISGMEPGEPETPRSYRDKKPPAKIAILSAGALMNFVLGVVLIFVLAFIGFPKQVVLVRAVVPEGPAYEAGLQPGDIVTTINRKRVKDEMSLRSAVRSAGDTPLNFELERKGEHLSVTVTPRSFEYVNEEGERVPYNQGEASIGVIHSVEVMVTNKVSVVVPGSVAGTAGIKPGDEIVEVNRNPISFGSDLYYMVADPEGAENPLSVKVSRGQEIHSIILPAGTTVNSLGLLFESEIERLPFTETITRALKNVYVTTVLFIENLRLLGTKEGLRLLSGPVAIGSIIAQSAQSSLYTLIQIAMVITINLGIINLFPIPPLDGGRIFFVLLEAVGLNVQERKRQFADVVGMVLLVSLILVLTFKDVLGLLRITL